MSLGSILLAILGVGILMMVHEYGHYLAARRFGMRVETFSIGFGPTLWKKKPKGSDTTFQIAIIPFLAYVKIAGMNPFEPTEKDDKGSYANASLWARIVTIAGGPLANYVFAAVLCFVAFIANGRMVPDKDATGVVADPIATSPASVAGMVKGDVILTVNGTTVRSANDIIAQVSAHPGEVVDIEVLRAGERVHVKPVIGSEGEKKGRIGVSLSHPLRHMAMTETLWQSFLMPPEVIYDNFRTLARVISGREKNAAVHGLPGIVSEGAKSIQEGFSTGVFFFAAISAALVAINMLPIPALDGGRLMFLLYEAVARKRANEKVETVMHGVALMMLIALSVVITINDLRPKK
jgi:regulator of sigma E protease